MIKKNSLLGQQLNKQEQKNTRGGINLCLLYSDCNFFFTNATDCRNWALAEGATRSSFNTSNCQCCARFYEPCGPGGIWL